MNTRTQRAYLFALAVKGNGEYRDARQSVLPKAVAKRGKSFTHSLRMKRSKSMMNTHHPKGMRSTIQPDERTARLQRAYRSRLAAKKDSATFNM